MSTAPPDDITPPALAALSLAAQVECLVYASKEPATINAMATALDASTREIEDALEQLHEQTRWRGVRLQRHGNKVQLVTAPELAARVQKFLGLEEVNRLSSAALETLAIIAYNQPVTRPQIENSRRELRWRDEHARSARAGQRTWARRYRRPSDALWRVV